MMPVGEHPHTRKGRRVLDREGRGRSGRGMSVTELIGRAGLYRVMAAAISNPQPGHVEAVGLALRDQSRLEAHGTTPPQTQAALKQVQHIWRRAAPDEIAGEYSRLFLGAGRVPLREGGYGDGLRFAGQPVDLADLMGFYTAFGFGPPAEAASPPDHLGTELEFLSILNLKLALALKRGRVVEAQTTRRAMALFLKDHLGRWIGALEAALNEASAHPAYARLAALAGMAIASDCRWLGVTPSPAGAGTAPDPVQEEALICPLAGQG